MSGGRVSPRDGLAAGLIAAALVIGFTWPMALRPASVGRVDSGDALHGIWNVAWVAHAITTGKRNIFDANIFHPHQNTLAFSESNIGAGILGIPAYLATDSAVATFNFAVLAGLWLSLLGTALLAWRLTGSYAGAFVAAVLFTFCPYIFAHTAHIQLLMAFGMPWALLAMHAFVDAPSAARAGVLGAAVAAQALFCGYYGVLTGLAVGVGCLHYAWRRRLWVRPRWWLLVLLAAAVSVLIVLPFFLPYMRLQKGAGFGRTLDEAYRYSADWRAYLASSAWMHRWMLKYLGHWKEVLFPGFAALVLATVGVVAGLRTAAGPAGARTPAPRETIGFYGLLGLLFLWASFGPAAWLYAVLYKAVPIFSLLRAPARFAIVVVLALAVLSAFGAAAVVQRFGARRRAAALVLCGLAVLDMSTPWPAMPVPAPEPAHKMLRLLPYGVVVELPFFWRSIDFHRHARYMFDSTYHWRPLINGYSDYIPPDFVDITVPVSSFPNPEGFQILRERRARYVLFRPDWYAASSRAALMERLAIYGPFLRPHVTKGDVWLYEIIAWPEWTSGKAPAATGR